MDDLKVILYVVIAIVWMIYNNYKKIGNASKKRDPSRPQPEIIEENWPGKESYKPSQTAKEQPVESINDAPERIGTPVYDKLKRKPLIRQGLSSKKRTQPLFLSTKEGGSVQPSKVTTFAENDREEQYDIDWIKIIKESDLKHAIVMSEILQKPYR